MYKHLTLITVVLMFAVGCTSLRFPGVYRIDIPQGNFVTAEMLEQLEQGMSQDHVRHILGAPTLTDPFTPDQWFYLMTYRPGQGDVLKQQVTVFFEQDAYSHYEGEVIDNLYAKTTRRHDRQLEQRVRDNERRRTPGQEPVERQDVPGATPGQNPTSPL